MLRKSLLEDDFLRYNYNVNDLSWMWTISEVKSHLKFVNGNIFVAFNFMEMMTDGCFISKIESEWWNSDVKTYVL